MLSTRLRARRVPRVLSVVAALAAGLAAQAPPQRQTVFRAGVVVVPIDVRVVDRDGKPVTDLTAQDFTLYEDGVPQQIQHFSAHTLTSAAPDPAVAPRRALEATTALAPQNRRLFLIVLGRGRLQEPSKALDALLRFVRERLLPQDQVALMAWNRATDFTTDHAKIAGVITRFRTAHEEIEAYMRTRFSGLAGLYAGKAIPAAIQRRIDAVFNDPLVGTQEVLPGRRIAPAEEEARKQIEDRLNRSGIETFRQFGGTDNALADLMADGSLGMDFDEYVALSRQTMQDVGNLYAGIDYLRFIEGEKHLVFVTEQGFLLPSADFDRDLAAIASDARVAIDTIQTGGVHTQVVNGMPVIPPNIGFQLSALRAVSDLSGGQAAISTRGETAFDRILAATSSGYLLGYSPSNGSMDGRFRQLKLEVKRRNVTVLYRRGYYARAELESFDPRRSLAMTRIVAAANLHDDINDLPLTLRLTDLRQTTPRQVRVDVIVNAERVVFATRRTPDGVGEHIAALNVAIFCSDANREEVGEMWKTFDIPVTAADFERTRKEGLRFSVDVPVRRRPSQVRVVVYDYGSDLVGAKYDRLR